MYYGSNYNFKAEVHYGQIIATDPVKYTAKVKFADGRVADDVGWLSAYQFWNGNGLYVMPEATAPVLLLEYAQGSYVILGFMPLRTTDEVCDRRCSRRLINQGDICIQGSDQCYILLKRACEFINVQVSPTCYVQLNSGNNTVNIKTQRAIISADGGVLTWDSDPETDNTTFSWVFRDKTDKNCNVANVIIGFHNTEDPEATQAQIDKSIFSLIVKEISSEQDQITSEDIRFKLIIGANGRIVCSAESIMEIYRSFIDRKADTFIRDIAKGNITRTSSEASIHDTANVEATTKAAIIHHNKGS